MGKPSSAHGTTSYAKEPYERKAAIGPLGSKRRELDVAHIEEMPGKSDLRFLTKRDIEIAYAKARKTKRFSENELLHIDVRLREIPRSAEEDRITSGNPMSNIPKPKPRPKEKSCPSLKELARLNSILLSEPKSSKNTAIWLMLQTGMRKGEALGLGWEYVDLENARIHIRWQYTNDRTIRPPARMVQQALPPPTLCGVSATRISRNADGVGSAVIARLCPSAD